MNIESAMYTINKTRQQAAEEDAAIEELLRASPFLPNVVSTCKGNKRTPVYLQSARRDETSAGVRLELFGKCGFTWTVTAPVYKILARRTGAQLLRLLGELEPKWEINDH